MRTSAVLSAVVCLAATIASAEETFVTIHKISGNQIAVAVDSTGGRGRGAMRGRRGGASQQLVVVTVPKETKVTTAMRERRTFEFRVGVQLAGGLQHRIFRSIREPLAARIVTTGGKITELNVITATTDINQSNANASDGGTVIAVRPKRPPQKKK